MKLLRSRTALLTSLLIGLYLLCVIVFYAVIGENAVIAVHDNLDLFVPQYRMMSLTGTWFADHAEIPFLGGLDRDYLPSQWNLVSLFYMLLPPFAAYVACYAAKVVIAAFGGFLLGKEICGEGCEGRILLASFGYGLLNLFPNFGICFASIPLAVWLFVRIVRSPSVPLYIALFCYPFVSYFSYFGIFLCGYFAVATVVLAIRRHRGWIRGLKATAVLALGYVVFEYRLFRLMLFTNEVSIRETMAQNSFTIGEALTESVRVFFVGMMHVDDGVRRFVLPAVLIGFTVINMRYIVRHEAGKIVRDPLNLCVLMLVFNAIVYGLYEVEGVRTAFETLLPPLKGFQFNRTVFFNPFLWYAALCLIAVRMKPFWGTACALIACAVALFYPCSYNDLYFSALQVRYAQLYGAPNPNVMTYGGFYSEEVFDTLKEEIGYVPGEYAVCFCLYPAVLEYNGIATIDGYLGYYPQSYKEDFRKVIAPAIDRIEESRIYYDDWGARCYLFSGVNPSVPYAVTQSTYGSEDYKNLGEGELYVDPNALRALDCRYVFSRITLDNAEDLGMSLAASATGEELTYPVYVYRLD